MTTDISKQPEGTGNKNTSQLSDLSLEFTTEEQWNKLVNEVVYIIPPRSLYFRETKSLIMQ